MTDTPSKPTPRSLRKHVLPFWRERADTLAVLLERAIQTREPVVFAEAGRIRHLDADALAEMCEAAADMIDQLEAEEAADMGS